MPCFRSIVTRQLPIEINVFVHLLESIGREVIMQARAWSIGGNAVTHQPEAWTLAKAKALDGLFLPRSWALDIVQRPPQKVQLEWSTQSFYDVLYQLLVSLRFDHPEQSREYITLMFLFINNSFCT